MKNDSKDRDTPDPIHGKNRLLLIVAGAILAMSLWTALFFFQIGAPTTSSEWIDNIYKKKERLIEESTPPRIILIGGSGTLFGFDSLKICKSTGIKTINFGTHAGLGIDYILYRAKKVLRSGDIAVIVPEYSHFTYTGPKEETQIDFVISRDRDYFFNRPWNEKLQYIYRMSLPRLMSGIYHKLNKTKINVNGLYGVHNINNLGDQINIKKSQRTKSDIMRLKTAKPANIASISTESRKILEKFSIFAKSMNVDIYMTPPAILDHKIYHTQKYKNFFSNIRKLAEELGYTHIGNENDFIMPEDMFFNTIYHLNSTGVEKRTARFIALLKPYINQRPQDGDRGPGCGQASSAPR